MNLNHSNEAKYNEFEIISKELSKTDDTFRQIILKKKTADNKSEEK